MSTCLYRKLTPFFVCSCRYENYNYLVCSSAALCNEINFVTNRKTYNRDDCRRPVTTVSMCVEHAARHPLLASTASAPSAAAAAAATILVTVVVYDLMDKCQSAFCSIILETTHCNRICLFYK